MFCWKGRELEVKIFGSSHASEIGVEISGFPQESFSTEKLQSLLDLRSGGKEFTTSRKEKDIPVFSDTENGKLQPLVRAVLPNDDVRSSDYNELFGIPRPSHADYAAYCKDGRLDFSGGGEFSGRMTAPLCVAGGIAKQLLEKRGVTVFAYVSAVGSVRGFSYKNSVVLPTEREKDFPSVSCGSEMKEEIFKAKACGDSVGGTVECVACGLPCGLGGALFDGLEGKLSSLLFAIPAVKGVEFGDGFRFAESLGSNANDQLAMQKGEVVFLSNKSGGINGGISNGMPVTMAVAFRPTPSIAMPQKTVNLVTRENVEIAISGRHDACVVPRAVPVVEAVVSLALLDEILFAERKK